MCIRVEGQVRVDGYSAESGELLSSGIRDDVIHSSVQQTWTNLSFGADQLEVDLVRSADETVGFTVFMNAVPNEN